MIGGIRRALGFVPLRQQLTPTECGAACLAMILAYYGRDVRTSELRDLLGVGRDGTSVRQLAAAAVEYGLEVGVWEGGGLPDTVRGPVIAHVDGDHFVVVERAGRRQVRVADPAIGRYWLSREEFAERYDGVALRLSRGPLFEERPGRLRDVALVRYLREFVLAAGTGGLLVKIIALAASLQLVALVLPLGTKYVVDTLIPMERLDLLPMLGVVVVGATALQVVLTAIRSVLLVILRVRADALLTSRFVEHLTSLPLSFFLQRSRGDLLMRIGGISATRENLTQQALTLVLDVALLSAYSIGLAAFAPSYLIVVLLLATAQVAVVLLTYGRVRRLAQRELATKSEEQNYLVEALDGMVSIKANGAQRRTVAQWRHLFDEFQAAMRRQGMFSAKVGGLHAGFNVLTPLALLWFGMWQVLSGNLTLGTMLAANSLATSLLNPVAALVGVGQLFAQLRAQLDRIYDVFDSTPESSGARVPSNGKAAHVKIENLTFRYQPSGAPILRDVDIDIPPGSKIGIVGPTGAGKTTLALLVIGLLPATPGTIRYNGVSLEEWDLARLRQEFGVVLQELTLFKGTIRENLTLARPDAPDTEIYDAARVAGLHDDVMALPMGYQTRVGEAGGALSAGQRQRVALARAVIHQPKLLVLDEATSHLDPATERRIDDALTQLTVTRVVVSHRLTAVKNADEIYVLRGGRVVEQGSHQQLITKGGLYTELFSSEPSPNGAMAH